MQVVTLFRACAGVRAQQSVSSKGVDHGEVGGGVLHYSHGGISVRIEFGCHEQGHTIYSAVLQGWCSEATLWHSNQICCGLVVAVGLLNMCLWKWTKNLCGAGPHHIVLGGVC